LAPTVAPYGYVTALL